MLTRQDLENDILRKSRDHIPHSLPLVPEEEFNASLARILADWIPAHDLWVFCYGSLIWNPLFHHIERQNVTIHGFHRTFCLRSRHGRGSVEQPGLMLGLDFGGCCNGVALRIPSPRLCADNAGMIAWVGARRLERGERADAELDAAASLEASGLQVG